MKKFDLNSALLLVCTALLTVCAFGIFSRPTLEEIDERMMMWGQHYGNHFSEVNKPESKTVVTVEETAETIQKE